MMLTKKQAQLLNYLVAESELGAWPSYDEMKAAIGIKSKNGVHCLIVGLEERGYIRRIPRRARCIEVIRRPADTAHLADLVRATFDFALMRPYGMTVSEVQQLRDQVVRLVRGAA